jgi:hypothetical protein
MLTYVDLLMKELNLEKPAVLDILTCIPEIVKIEPKKVCLNIKQLKAYLRPDDLIKLIIDYPIVIPNYKNIERIEFYMNLYFEMNKDEFYNMVMKFPLLLIADVKIY